MQHTDALDREASQSRTKINGDTVHRTAVRYSDKTPPTCSSDEAALPRIRGLLYAVR